MINISIQIDTDPKGRMHCKFEALGIGSAKEADLAIAIVALGNAAFDVATLADGGNPQITQQHTTITPLGQG